MTTLPLIIALLLVQPVWTATGLDIIESDTAPALENVLLDHDGTVRLSAALAVRAELEENSVWTIVPGPGGNWHAGTGSAGRLYAGGAGTGASAAAAVGEGDLLAVVQLPGQGLFFGLTPGGDVYRLVPGGDPEIAFATGEDYVFDLLAGSDGDIYVATGPAGRLYRFRPGAGGEVVYAAPQAHLTKLAWLEPGRVLLVGSSPGGMVYRLDLRPGSVPEVSVLYDTPAEEIRGLTVTRESGVRVHIAANPPADTPGETGTVLCVGENGARIWQWAVPDSAVYDIAAAPGGLLVATGREGLIYRLDPLGRAAIWQKLPAARVLCLAPAGDGFLAGTSDPALVVALAAGPAASGWVESPVRDCEGPAAFGRLTRRADIPSGASLALDTRTGNSETPDETWAEWQPADGTVRSRPARFIQWRARLGSGFPGRTPALERVDIHYAIPNRPPFISGLELEEIDPADAARGEPAPVRDLGWSAADPDGDSLRYTIEYRPDAAGRWLLLADDLAESSYPLDTRLLPDGWYRFRVRATDAPSRPRDEALEAELVSAPVLLDNTPPRITGLRLDGARLRFTVTDESSVISAARVSVNAGPWLPAAPDDRLFDRPEENFSVELELRPGTNHIAVRAADAQGNSVTAALAAER